MGLHHQGELQSQYQQQYLQYQAQQQLVQLLALQLVIMLHIINITNIIKTSAINKVQQQLLQPTMQVSVIMVYFHPLCMHPFYYKPWRSD